MTEPGGPPRRTLCFLSTLLSQKVPERSDAVLRCIVYGQPKPEITWYKNGQAIDESDMVSSYEFFENQYIHLLHLSCCTTDDAAVYQVTAKNCSGMICCSASIEVQCSTENPQLSSTLEGDRDAGWEQETGTHEEGSANQTDKEECPWEEEGSISRGTPLTAGSDPHKLNCPHSLQLRATDATHASSSETVPDVKDARQNSNTEDLLDGLCFLHSTNTPDKQDECCPQTGHSQVAQPMGDGLNASGPSDAESASRHQQPKAHKYISCSLPLSQVTECLHPRASAPGHEQVSPQVSSEDSDSDYELCPEITLTYTEEFSDDDLEYLECSDVMTDYSNAVWQRNLQGTDHVFLLESDDEEVEFSECGLGGREHFLSVMGCGPRVSGDTGPMDATAGFCGHHSQPQEVGTRSSGACRPSSPALGTLRPHPAGPAPRKEQGSTAAPPTASEAAENDYPGIQGETRDSHEAGEELPGDILLTTERAVVEKESEPWAGGSGMMQCPGTVGERDSGSKQGSQKPPRGRRLGTKGRPRPLSANLPESAPESPDLLHPWDAAEHPPIWSAVRGAPLARADAAAGTACVRAGERARPAQTQRAAKPLPTPAASLPQGRDASLAGEQMQGNDPKERSQVPDHSDPLQVQTQDMPGERTSLCQMPASSVPGGQEAPFTGTTANSSPNSEGIHRENSSLAQLLEAQSCTQGPQQAGKEENTPRGFWKDLEHVLSTPAVSEGSTSLGTFSACLPRDPSTAHRQHTSLSVAGPEPKPTDTAHTLETMCDGSRDRGTVCVTECFEAGDQGTRCDTTGSPVGASVDTYVPQEMCSMGSKLAEGQSEERDLRSPEDKTPGVFSQAQGPEPLRTTCETSPVFISTFTWTISRENSEADAEDKPAGVGNSTSTLASTVQAVQEEPSPGNWQVLEATQFLFSQDNSWVRFKAGGAPDTLASHSPSMDQPQGKSPALPTSVECLQGTGKMEDPSVATVATEAHVAKYRAMSIAENSHADGAQKGPRVSHGQPGPAVRGPTNESTKERPCVVPRAPGRQGCVAQLPAGEGLCSNPPLQIASQSADTAVNRRLGEECQDGGGETQWRGKQDHLSLQGSLSAHDFRGSLPTTSAAQEGAPSVPLDHVPANSREEGRQSPGLGTSGSVVTEAIVATDSQALSAIPSLSEILLDIPKETGLGGWEAGRKLKIITLEAPLSEIWPPRQAADSEYKASDVSPQIPDHSWAVSDALKASGAPSDPDGLETAASAMRRPQDQSHLALADSGETRRGGRPASSTHWSSLSSQSLSQAGLLESSVDPIDETELSVGDLLSETSETGGKERVRNASKDPQETQFELARPVSFKRLLSCPGILESSVDPTDVTAAVERTRVEKPEPSEATQGATGQGNDGHLGQRAGVQPALLQSPCPQEGREISQDQEYSERQDEHDQAGATVTPTTGPVPRPDHCRETVPRGSSLSQTQEVGNAEHSLPAPPLSSCPAAPAPAPVGLETHNLTGQNQDIPVNDLGEQRVFSDAKGKGAVEKEPERHVLSSRDFTPSPRASSPERNITHLSRSRSIEEPNMKARQTGESKPPSSSGSPEMTLAPIPREWEPEKALKLLQTSTQKGCSPSRGTKSREKCIPVAAQPARGPAAPAAGPGAGEGKKKQEVPASGHLAEGVKKKILSRVAALRLRLEEKENARKTTSFLKKIPKPETSLPCADEERHPKTPPCKREGKAPVLLRKIQAEMFPDRSGNVKLSCQFAEIHEDSTIWWTKDSKSIAQVQRSAGDNSTVSLSIVQASQEDQGLYTCCLENSYGKASAQFHLTAEVLKQLSGRQNTRGCEEIEFSQLIFKEDFLSESYFGGCLRGQIATEELHFGEGVHRKAFRSTVMRGLTPVFKPGHACVLKVHNAVAYGTRNNDELIQKNYRLAAQECYVQNTARHYAKIYAAETQPLEGFGEVPEIIPIFLIHRPENNIPYATVEEELIGEFVKYSIRDGKEINFLRRDSEAGQKCCTFQHWVYQKTSGCLLVTDMQGVGMKLTDVGIATLAKGYKGFKGNCSMTFIDQFKALHQCNKYCKMLGLKSLQNNNQRQRRPSLGKSRTQASSVAARKPGPGSPADKTS
ncbi:alpha-protein kinase 2 isoform X2 [Oryctolagus cuniculus]|uniref:alpha-protein kinase 2 isoform X2 n=1 Tax=Oryctolagus cuniculus TaxID=9986 RepID=UPI003878FE2C